MKDFLTIGSSPIDEKCAQVGSPDYDRISRIECNAFINQLKRLFPKGDFGIKSNPHDFGTYREVVASYSIDPQTDEEREEMEAAFEAEGKTPERWDEEALKEIASALRTNKSETAFDAWLKKVDACISAETGLGYRDLPDWNYRDSFEAGETPAQAAKQAIKAANE